MPIPRFDSSFSRGIGSSDSSSIPVANTLL
eukprot:gene26826-biopygen17415